MQNKLKILQSTPKNDGINIHLYDLLWLNPDLLKSKIAINLPDTIIFMN